MAMIDIQKDSVENINEIKFSDGGYGSVIEHCVDGIFICDSYGYRENFIPCEDIPNLILSLQKAVELGWDKK